MNRFVEVDFNSLETNLNLQTWVIVLEFFGIGVPQQPASSQPSSPGAMSSHSEWNGGFDGNQLTTEMEGKKSCCNFILDFVFVNVLRPQIWSKSHTCLYRKTNSKAMN